MKSPCVGICTTSISGNTCRGCVRFSHEVIAWNGLDQKVKWLVHLRRYHLLSEILTHQVIVEDSTRLAAQARCHGVDLEGVMHPVCWVFLLLNKVDLSPRDAGFRWLIPPPSRVAWVRQMEERWYQLSDAHYDRYFAKH